MNRKIISLFISTLLIATILSAIGIADDNENNNITNRLFDGIIDNTHETTQTFILKGDQTFYAHRTYPSANNDLVSFDPTLPGTLNSIATATSTDFLAGGCWAEDTWWAVEYADPSNANIWTIDHITGTMTLVGASGSAEGLNGLAYDSSTGTMYACSGTNLYSIDMITAAATLVGSMSSSGLMIGIACDNAGNMYGVDLGDDSLYSIDTTTGAATLIGSLGGGIDLNYAQDCAYDKDNDILYLAALTIHAGNQGTLYTIDTTTGIATSVGMIGTELTELVGFAIPYASGPSPQDVMITALEANWNLVSLPFNVSLPKANITVNYGGTNYSWADAVTYGYVNDVVFGWDRVGQSYNFANTFVPGDGYWMYAYYDCELWVDNITIVPDEYVTSLEQNWNLMGVPSVQNLDKVNITVNYGGTDYSWADAVTNGYVNDVVFGWDRGGQSYNFANMFIPGDGYWMYAYFDCILKRPVI